MKNWKTTAAGAFAAAVNAGVANYGVIAGDPTAKMNWGAILLSSAIAAFGYFAKDNNVTGGSVTQ